MCPGNWKITIVVPVYNSEALLPRCIDSILDQTYRNLQIILVDDGSTDSSGKICDDYAKQDRRVEVYHTANRGSVVARKEGILRARGDYIGFVDADDYIEPDMFALLLHDLCESNADFIHTGYIEETGKSRIVTEFEDRVFTLKDIKEKEDIIIRYVLQAKSGRHICNSVWSKLYKRELICNCYLPLPDEQQYGEDLLCLCLCILESRVICLRRRALYHYVVREKSLSHLKIMEQALEETKLNYQLINIFQKYGNGVYESIKEHISCYLMISYMNIMQRCGEKKIWIPYFYYKNIGDLQGKKVVVYGAGRVGQDLYIQFRKYREIEIVAWLDSNWHKYKFDYAHVGSIAELNNCEYDIVVIAVKEESMAKEIGTVLIGNGTPREKIVWEKPGNILEDSGEGS